MKISNKLKEKMMGFFPHLFSDILYRLDWRKPNKESVKEYLDRNVKLAYDLKTKKLVPTFRGTQDEKVIKALKWAVKNITYKKDSIKWNTPEVWEDLNDILARWYEDLGSGIQIVGAGYTQPKSHPTSFRCADCESFALVIYCLCVSNGVNPINLRYCAGEVIGGGHSWLEYAPDEMFDYENDKQNWYVIDGTYYPDTRPFDRRHKKSSRYLKTWFSINHIQT